VIKGENDLQREEDGEEEMLTSGRKGSPPSSHKKSEISRNQ
jgi:hypothetical protein